MITETPAYIRALAKSLHLGEFMGPSSLPQSWEMTLYIHFAEKEAGSLGAKDAQLGSGRVQRGTLEPVAWVQAWRV